MQYTAPQYRHARSLIAALLILVGTAEAYGADTYNGVDLSSPAIAFGTATLFNVVVAPASVVSVQGGTANGSEDSYNPANDELAIPSVVVGGNTYTNVLVKAGSLISVGSVSGADTLTGNELTIPSLQVLGGSIYANVVLTIGSIVSTGGGMPANVRDVYNPGNNQLTIAAVQWGGKVYTNALVTVGTIVSAAGSPFTQYLIFTDNTGLWLLNELTDQVTKLASGAVDVNGVAYQAGSLAVAGGKAYFAAGDANNPLALYASNGAAAGTVFLKFFPAGNSPATLADFTPLANGSALFVYYDGNGNQTLWTANGSGVTEVMLAGAGTPYTNTSGVFPSINLGPGQSGEIAGNLLFTDNAGLWSLDESTNQVTELAAGTVDVNGVGYQAGSLAVAGGKAYFAAGDANDPLALFASDGTARGTTWIASGGTFPNPATLADFTPLSNGRALFVYYEGNGSQSLWTTDGIGVAEVTIAHTLAPYSNDSGVFPSINLGPGQSGEIAGNLLFTDNAALWSLNESTNEVTELAAITGDVNGLACQAGSLAVAGGKAYFAAGDANNPLALYASDGTAAGTVLVETFAAAFESPATLADFTPLANGSALFVYYDGNGKQTLWTTNGSGVTEVMLAGTGTPYTNTSGVFPSINLGPGQSGAP